MPSGRKTTQHPEATLLLPRTAPRLQGAMPDPGRSERSEVPGRERSE